MKFFIKDFFSYLVTFTEEILNGKLHFLCSIKRDYYTFFETTIKYHLYYNVISRSKNIKCCEFCVKILYCKCHKISKKSMALVK